MKAGDLIGAYRVLDRLGEGGMGEVYKAKDEKLDRFVALKVLHTTRAADPAFRERFQREARAVAALAHPHIVTVHAIEEHEGSPFLTMEFIEGRTLAGFIQTGGASLQQFLQIAIPLADAVPAAHARRITHRDLKPNNVMVTTDGRLKVLDFGLAKLTEVPGPAAGFTSLPTEHLTAHGQIVGTVAYMSPEQAEGKPVDHRSDIFSLGIILYELATGRKPFNGDTNVSLISSILRDAPTPVTELNPALPREIGRLIRRCLEKDPVQRLQNALDLKHELEDVRSEGASSISLPASTASAAPAPAAKPPSSTSQISIVVPVPGRRLAWLGAIVAALVVIGSYWLWTRSSTSRLETSAGPAAATPAGTDRITVARFENRTGDATLDPIGDMVADAITREFPRLVHLARAPLGRGESAPQRLAVTGAYFLDGQSVRIQGSVLDGAGTVLHATEPAISPRTDAGKAIDLTRERILGAIATFTDPTFPMGRPSRPPLYGAYREFSAGMDLFADEPLKAIEHFKRATELDPDFFTAWSLIATAYANVGDRARQAEIHERMNAMRDRLTPGERARLAWSLHSAEGRILDALKALREAETFEPDNLIVNYLIGYYELRLNRPQATIDQYNKVNAEMMNRSTPGGWRYSRLTAANHLLGRHEEELRLAIVAKGLFPSSLFTRNDELSALAALGRMDELRRAVDDTLTITVLGGGTPGASMRVAAEELRAHGRRTESLELAKRSVAWYRNRPPSELTEANRLALAQSLYAAEEWAEAGKLTATLLKEQPANTVYVTLAGAIAARIGERAVAAKHAAALAQEPSAPAGAIELRRAQLASLMGEREQAVELLRTAFARGLSMSTALHRHMDFEPLRGFAPFDELMRPKG